MYIHRVNKSGITAFNNRAYRTAINTIHSSIIRSSLPLAIFSRALRLSIRKIFLKYLR